MNVIKKLRQEKGLTQVELAKIFSLDQTTVSKWELGKALPDTQMLIHLAEFFDVSTDFLLGISTFYYPDKIKTAHDNSPYSSSEQALLQNFRKLPADLQHRATVYMEKLVELSTEETQTTFSPATTQAKKVVAEK